MRLLILGSGAVTRELYVPALNALGWSQMVTVADSSENSLEACRALLPEASYLRCSWQDAFTQLADTADAAVVALPNALHEQATSLALRNGLHVLCEKPLSLRRESAIDLAKLADQQHRILAVGMVRRLLPSVQALERVLRQELVGAIESIDIEDGNPYSWVTESPEPFKIGNGGVVADMGIHYLDIVYHLFGPLEPLEYSDDSYGGVEANCLLRLITRSGVPVRMKFSRTRRLRNTAIFRGTRGDLLLEKDTFDQCLFQLPGQATGVLRVDQPFESGKWDSTLEACFAEQLFRFRRATLSGKLDDFVSAREAANSVKVIEWCYSNRSITVPTPAIQPTKTSPCFKSAAVTGGTGFIGTHLVHALNQAKCEEIQVLLRSYRTCSTVARYPARLTHCDLLKPEAVADAIRDCRYVFHLAYGQDGRNPSTVTIEGTRNVVEAAIKADAKAVVVLSSAYVFGQAADPTTVDETAPYKPYGGEYGQSKAFIEKWCLDRARTSGKTRIVVLNPTCVFGSYGGAYTTLPVQLASERSFCWIEEGRGAANYTYVVNLVHAMMLAAVVQHAHGQRFIINDGTITWRELLTPFLPQDKEYSSYTRGELLALNQHGKLGLLEALVKVFRHPEVRGAIAQTAFGRRAKAVLNVSAHRVFQKLQTSSTKRGSLNIAAECKKHRSVPPLWLADLYGTSQLRFSSAKAHQQLSWYPTVSLQEGQCRTKAWLEKKDSDLF